MINQVQTLKSLAIITADMTYYEYQYENLNLSEENERNLLIHELNKMMVHPRNFDSKDFDFIR